MSTAIQPKKMGTKELISWALTIGLPAMILFIPQTEVFTLQMKFFFAITLFAILTFAFDNINQTTISLMLPLAYILTGVAAPNVVFSPWSSFVIWMTLGGLILAGVLARIGLLNRIAYKCIILTGASYNGILYGLTIVGVLLNLVIPGQIVIPMAALSFGICNALDLGKSRESAGIMLTAAMASLVPLLGMFNTSIPMMMGIGMDATGPIQLAWFDYIKYNLPNYILVFVLAFVATKMFKPTKVINGKDYFVTEQAKLGKMKIEEKKAIVICILLLLFLMTGSIHGIEAGWGFAFIPLLLFLPGVNVGTNDDLKTANYPFILFVAACMGIGSVASSLGLGGIISEMIMPLLEGKSSMMVLFFIWALCFLLNFLLTPLAIMSAFSLPFAQIAVDLGINPSAMYFVMYHGLDQILMPYEYALYLIFFSFGLVYLKDFMKFMGAKVILDAILVFGLLIPFWNLIGYL